MTEGGIEKEEIGRAHLEKHHGGTWIKCSNFTVEGVHLEGRTPFRGYGPAVGWYYNSTLDIFQEPRPKDRDGDSCGSWVLNNTTGKYDPPIAKPTDGADYKWDESLYISDNSKGWIKIADT